MKIPHTNFMIVLAAFGMLTIVGAGCPSAPPTTDTIATAEGNIYQNDQYGFAFDYPTNIEVRVRAEEVRESEYAGLNVDFFASLRDTVRESKPVNIAYFYAAADTTIDQFKASLEASDPAIKVTAEEKLTVGGINLTKLTNSTALGIDKYHYLFEGKDGSLIIVSVFLNEEENFDPVLQTIRLL